MRNQRTKGLFLFAFSFLCAFPLLATQAFAAELLDGDSPFSATDGAVPLISMAPEPLAMVTPGETPDRAATTSHHTLANAGAHVRKLLADFAMTLRDIRYRRGGHDPSTGFDCSGFVRYVFRHSVDQELPSTSASQFHAGEKVDRDDMKTGDLVFFRTHGKRVSHVGIYLDHGRFIHSPSTGKRVSISHLDDAYWSKRFVGAKRPDGLS